MKKLLPFLLFLYLLPAFSQTQIGNDIDLDGYDVSLSADGSRLVVGAPGFNGNNAGLIRIYDDINGSWIQVGNDIYGEAADDQFGTSVSISADGKRVAAGAPFNDGNGNKSGHVQIFEEINGFWAKIGSNINGVDQDDRAGFSIQLSADGKRVAIGAYQHLDDIDVYAGHVRIFEEVNNVWSQVGDEINGAAAYDLCGFAVSLSDDGTTVAIGSPNNSGNNAEAGHVRIFSDVGGVWTQIGQDLEGDNFDDNFGYAVDLSSNGKHVVIGSNIDGGDGLVRVYQEVNGSWSQVGTDLVGGVLGHLGLAVTISDNGKRIALGIDKEETVIYDIVGGVWTPLGNVISNGGWSVGLSGPGDRLAIGDAMNTLRTRVYELVPQVNSGNNPLEYLFNFVINPNPTSGIGVIDYRNRSEGEIIINFMNPTGNIIHSVVVRGRGSGHVHFDLSNYKSGVYPVQITDRVHSVFDRIVLVKH